MSMYPPPCHTLCPRWASDSAACSTCDRRSAEIKERRHQYMTPLDQQHGQQIEVEGEQSESRHALQDFSHAGHFCHQDDTSAHDRQQNCEDVYNTDMQSDHEMSVPHPQPTFECRQLRRGSRESGNQPLAQNLGIVEDEQMLELRRTTTPLEAAGNIVTTNASATVGNNQPQPTLTEPIACRARRRGRISTRNKQIYEGRLKMREDMTEVAAGGAIRKRGPRSIQLVMRAKTQPRQASQAAETPEVEEALETRDAAMTDTAPGDTANGEYLNDESVWEGWT